MLLLLPPSETKRDGGDPDRSLDLADLSWPGFNPARRRTLAALRSLSRNRASMATALGLGSTQLHEIDRNRAIRTSPVMPAIERYTGVLFEALGADSLSEGARGRAARCVVIHSALFGLLGADDPIPAYRLSHDSRLPGLALAAHWRAVVSAELARPPGLVLDLRSDGYAKLGPLAAGVDRWFVRIVAEAPDGSRRALNHFNKRGKGELVRALLETDDDLADTAALMEWAQATGVRLRTASDGVLELTVEEIAARRG
ncbi:MAG: hypothetical protein RI885_1291 [Actinomycetota bacterium]|jgi:cytoplasmic iron level regulating protein YaaA (DUF328/UPF0246 family)